MDDLPPINVKLVAETTPRHHQPLYPMPVPTTLPNTSSRMARGGSL